MNVGMYCMFIQIHVHINRGNNFITIDSKMIGALDLGHPP